MHRYLTLISSFSPARESASTTDALRQGNLQDMLDVTREMMQDQDEDER